MIATCDNFEKLAKKLGTTDEGFIDFCSSLKKGDIQLQQGQTYLQAYEAQLNKTGFSLKNLAKSALNGFKALGAGAINMLGGMATFTNEDCETSTANEWTNIVPLTSGETHQSIFTKMGTMFRNIRYLFKELGTTDISSIGDGTVKGAVSTLNSNLNTKQNASTAITMSNIASQSVRNADTVDGLYGWFLGTLNNQGVPHGTTLPMYCKHNVNGDNRFKISVEGFETCTDYATNSLYATYNTNNVALTRMVYSIPSQTTAYHTVQSLATFTDSNNALISGSKGQYIFGISAFSDERLKTNIKDSKINALDTINQIKLREFDEYSGSH